MAYFGMSFDTYAEMEMNKCHKILKLLAWKEKISKNVVGEYETTRKL